MKYHVERDVTAAAGTQTYVVEAKNAADAKEKFLAGKAELESNDVEVLDLSPWDFEGMYSE